MRKRRQGAASRAMAGGERIGGATSPGTEGDRFREALEHVLAEHCDGSQSTLAQLLGIQRTRISEWKAKDGIPGREALDALGRAFGISVDWILFGDGAMYRRQDRAPQRLALDLQAQAQQRALAAVRRDVDPGFDADIVVNGETLLREALDSAAARAVDAARRHVAADRALTGLRSVQRVLWQLEEMAARTVPGEQQQALAREVHRTEARLEALLAELPTALGEGTMVSVRVPEDSRARGLRVPGRASAVLRQLDDALAEAQGDRRERRATLYDIASLHEERERLAQAERDAVG